MKREGQNPSTTHYTPELRFGEFGGAPDSAKASTGNWEEKSLGEFLTFKNGINTSKDRYRKGYKFINVLDIIENPFITYERIRGSVDVSIKEFQKNV